MIRLHGDGALLSRPPWGTVAEACQLAACARILARRDVGDDGANDACVLGINVRGGEGQVAIIQCVAGSSAVAREAFAAESASRFRAVSPVQARGGQAVEICCLAVGADISSRAGACS